MNLILNAKLNDTNNLYNIYYEDKIKKIILSSIDKAIDYPNNTLDIKGNILIPGGIDSHVHFNDPGFTAQEDFQTGTLSAAYGGITTIIDMPCTSLPPVTTTKNLENKLNAVRNKAVIDFGFWAGVNGADKIDNNMLQNLKELRKKGVTAFKIYTISGMPSYKALSYNQIDKLFNLTKNENFIFAFHAEDLNIIESSINKIPNGEKNTVKGYLLSRPIEAETVAIKNIIDIAKKYNTKIHIVHISTKKGLKLVEDYQNATAETCPHYLEFTEDDLYNLKGRLKTAPVVKKLNDKEYLRESVINGKINFITTDHAGTDFEKNKLNDEFSKVYNGIPGTQFMLPYLFTSFYDKEKLNLARIIELSSENCAKQYGLYPNKGSLELNTDADFTIMDKKEFIVNENTLKSKGKYSPFNGMKFSYQVNKTILRGKLIFDTEKNLDIEYGYGDFIKSKYEIKHQ